VKLPCLLPGISSREYHSDIWGSKVDPTFSRTAAFNILSRSPLAAYAHHPKLGGLAAIEDDEEPATDSESEERDHGSIYHELLLGGGESFVILPYDNFRTKDARAKRDVARADGLIPVCEPKWQAIRATADRMRETLIKGGVNLGECEKEATLLWETENEIEEQFIGHGLKLRCKARTDLLDMDGPRIKIQDLKIKEYINLGAFMRTIDRFGLDIQAACYVEAVEAVYPKMAGRVDYEFVLLEKKPPYDLAVIPADKVLLAIGGMKWRMAKLRWSRCLATGRWPGIGRVDAQVPPYILAETVGRFVGEFGSDSLPSWLSAEED
jgi:hypothetical protein